MDGIERMVSKACPSRLTATIERIVFCGTGLHIASPSSAMFAWRQKGREKSTALEIDSVRYKSDEGEPIMANPPINAITKSDRPRQAVMTVDCDRNVGMILR